LQSSTEEGELGFWEVLHATAQVLHHGSPPSKPGGAAYRRLHRRLQMNNVGAATTSANEQYVRSAPIFVVHHVLQVHV
jgi:hypothetical protein